LGRSPHAYDFEDAFHGDATKQTHAKRFLKMMAVSYPTMTVRWRLWLAVGCVGVYAAVLAWVGFPPASIWMDESWSAAAANLSMLDAILLTMRFDLHPPLYYMQMSLWGWVGQSDEWLFGNSVFWGALTAASLTLIAGRRYGWRIGVASGLILASLPYFGTHVHQMRMYPMLMALSVWAWGAWGAALKEPRIFWRWAALAVFMQCLLAYAHAAGAMMAGFIGLWALAIAIEKDRAVAGLKRLMIAQAVFALASLPALANSSFRSTSYQPPTLDEIVATMARLIAGSANEETVAAAVMAWAIVVFFGVFHRRTRVMTLCLIAVPFVFFILVNFLARPMWQTRLFAHLLPFFAVIVALLLDTLARQRVWVMGASVSAIVLTCAVQTIHLRETRTPQQDYRSLAAEMLARVQPGDEVFAPRFWDYWAVMRYAFGADWGSPLVVQSRSTSERWQSIYNRLGLEGLPMLRLAEQSDRIVRDEVIYLIGPATAERFSEASRIWVVQPISLESTLPFADSFRIGEAVSVSGLRLVAYERAPNSER
jgi:hypothetical protein